MLDLILAGSALIFGKNVIKSTLNAVDQTVPQLINQSANAAQNLASLASNATESLPTFGLSIAASHLMDMESELKELNDKHGTQYTSYKDIVEKYKKIGS